MPRRYLMLELHFPSSPPDARKAAKLRRLCWRIDPDFPASVLDGAVGVWGRALGTAAQVAWVCHALGHPCLYRSIDYRIYDEEEGEALLRLRRTPWRSSEPRLRLRQRPLERLWYALHGLSRTLDPLLGPRPEKDAYVRRKRRRTLFDRYARSAPDEDDDPSVDRRHQQKRARSCLSRGARRGEVARARPEVGQGRPHRAGPWLRDRADARGARLRRDPFAARDHHASGQWPRHPR